MIIYDIIFIQIQVNKNNSSGVQVGEFYGTKK